MKKTWIILLSAFIFACNNAEKKDGTGSSTTGTADTSATTTTAALPDGITQADVDKGLNLVANADCLTCHQISTKIQGPSYKDVANKYEPTKENITMLAGKIIKGGSGVWGPIAMTPHPDLSQEDAEAMVKYVMSLKNAK